MTLFRRSNDIEVSLSPEFDKEYGPGETLLSIPASTDAGDADVKSLPRPPNRSHWTNTPGTRQLKEQFDGDWLSPRGTTPTERPEIVGRLAYPRVPNLPRLRHPGNCFEGAQP